MEGSRTSKGIPIINIIPLLEDEKVTSICPIDNFDAEDKYLLFVTKQGIVKRTHVGLFKNIRQTGIIAINLNESDELLNVLTTNGQKDIILGASNGKAIRFSETDMRDISRSAIGVRGIKLADGEEVVGVGIVESDDDDILVLSEKGYGKRSKASEYRTQGRGGQGVKTLNVTEKNGKLAAIKIVHDDEDLIATTDKGMVIRCRIKDISTTGRATQGVIVMRLANNHTLSTIAIVPTEEDDVVEEVQVETPETIETNDQVTE
jgi:DNA gyrase subunit A